MTKVWMKLGRLPIIIVLSFTLIAGCSEQAEEGTSPTLLDEPPKPNEIQYLEVWRDNLSNVPLEKDGKYSQYLIEKTGIGIYSPVVLWDGGRGYLQRLSTRIGSGHLPDLFMPWKGNESMLIRQGSIADLTDYLPKYAPHLWERIPESIWDIVRSADPLNEGGIYYIPYVQSYAFYGPVIRKDWLDRVGLKVPKTQDEYVRVLKAFRDQDANGNGDPHDEIPVSGREFGRWMDDLFGMYGVAMWEGFPMWDLYDGKLTYSAVTPNMKAALAFIRELYAEKLLDPNTFLNLTSDWLANIHSDKVGTWFHINTTSAVRMQHIAKVNSEVELVALGVLDVEGYNGFITKTQINRPQWVIANKNEQTIINALRLLDWATNPDHMEAMILGLEGLHHKIQDGKKVLLEFDSRKLEPKLIVSVVDDLASVQKSNEFSMNSLPKGERRRIAEMRDQIIIDNQPYGKVIAGDGIPSKIYNNYPEIKNLTLYHEYMTKIIIGEWPISKFDEFVQKWYAIGGIEVTERARDWYAQLQNR
jgi:putative aldouronate transport system substrate-binding protein